MKRLRDLGSCFGWQIDTKLILRCGSWWHICSTNSHSESLKILGRGGTTFFLSTLCLTTSSGTFPHGNWPVMASMTHIPNEYMSEAVPPATGTASQKLAMPRLTKVLWEVSYSTSTKASGYYQGARGDYTIVFPVGATHGEDGSSKPECGSVNVYSNSGSGSGYEAYYMISFPASSSSSASSSADASVYVGDVSGRGDSSSNVQQVRSSVPAEYFGINCPAQQ
ncbi:uncharacterized protein IUM83_19167 [Phytophthora cinnamomi]|uniref:uncharacterized protein n=1 Tax=Phytophthora cinnamomi TaxID=4785 RepID=UPI003559385F|nr:hypothetical protein IUM83_19167 [Phytophthora cinnamomi]